MAVAAVVIGGALWTPDAGVLRAAASLPVLNLRLTAVDRLPSTSKATLIAEAESIWQHEGIRLRWLHGSEARAGDTLRVLVTPRTVGAAPDGEPWPVAELLRFEGSAAIAVASISGAERVVSQSGRVALLDYRELRDYRLGLVLGRAVAHEIGHYLLQSNAHADRGLMRATIDAYEFANPRSDSFRLADDTRALLAARPAAAQP